jgi:hypothetical protein
VDLIINSPPFPRAGEVMLNEGCRTRKGLESLIQKNWVSLGFPFSRRHQLCSRMGEVNMLSFIVTFFYWQIRTFIQALSVQKLEGIMYLPFEDFDQEKN